MPRLRQVSRADADPFAQQLYTVLFGDRDPVKEPGTATGTPGNWWTVFALVPDAFKHTTEGFQFCRSKNRKISPKLRELGQIRAGFARGSQFVFSQHCKACRDVGFSEAQVKAIPYWQIADVWSPVERAVLAYTDCLVLMGGRVPEELFAELKKHLSDEEILELTYITATYEMHATMSKALRLEYDDVDERVVEIAAPSDTSNDVMRMVDKRDDTKNRDPRVGLRPL
jgi:alkylhydroperoxidase family enzyme